MSIANLDWTATGTMLTAWFTLLLVVLALWAGRHAKSAASAAWKSVTEQALRDRSAQASRVYTSPAVHGENAAHLVEPSVIVTNASDLPIYEVVVEIEDGSTGNRDELREKSIMPGKEVPLYVTAGVLTHKWGWSEQVDGEGNRQYTLPKGAVAPSFSVSLRFRDSSNQTWHRDAAGVLSAGQPLR